MKSKYSQECSYLNVLINELQWNLHYPEPQQTVSFGISIVKTVHLSILEENRNSK